MSELENLRRDVRRGLDDLEAGRVQDFDSEAIIAEGKKLLAEREKALGKRGR